MLLAGVGHYISHINLTTSGLCTGNVALNMSTLQSSQLQATGMPPRGLPGLAVDGNLGTADSECTETLQEARPWWLVDLAQEHTVKYVAITSGRSCGKLNAHHTRVSLYCTCLMLYFDYLSHYAEILARARIDGYRRLGFLSFFEGKLKKKFPFLRYFFSVSLTWQPTSKSGENTYYNENFPQGA